MKTLSSIAGIATLALALADGPLMAAIVLPGSATDQIGGSQAFLQSWVKEFLPVTEPKTGLTSAAGPAEGEDCPVRIEVGRYLTPGDCATPSTSASWNSSGPTGAAVLNAFVYLAEASLQTTVCGEGVLLLTTGPPFELLRPV